MGLSLTAAYRVPQLQTRPRPQTIPGRAGKSLPLPTIFSLTGVDVVLGPIIVLMVGLAGNQKILMCLTVSRLLGSFSSWFDVSFLVLVVLLMILDELILVLVLGLVERKLQSYVMLYF